MSSSYESFESLGAHHPIEVSLTVAQAEERERRGIPLPIGGDAETDHAKELLAIRRARQEHEAQTAAAPVVETGAAGEKRESARCDGTRESRQVDPALLLNKGLELLNALRLQVDRLGAVVLEDQTGPGRKPDRELKGPTFIVRCTATDESSLAASEPVKDNLFNLSEESIRQLELLLRPTKPVNDSSHETSPSVGALDSAVCDNSNPTEGAFWIDEFRNTVEREKELAAKRGTQYDRYQDNVRPGDDIRLTVGEAMDNERDGYPTPVSGDPVVTLQEAIERGAVTVTKGLPAAVVWSRANPGLAKTRSPIHWTSHGLQMSIGLWPAPSHQALEGSMKALAGVQRRLMFAGRLAVAQ